MADIKLYRDGDGRIRAFALGVTDDDVEDMKSLAACLASDSSYVMALAAGHSVEWL